VAEAAVRGEGRRSERDRAGTGPQVGGRGREAG